MKIVHLIDYFQPKIGYQETFLAREHKKMGHKVFVVTSDRYFPFPDYDNTFRKLLGRRIIGSGRQLEEGIETIRLPIIEISYTNLVFLIGLKNILLKLQPDIVLCHGMHSFTPYLAAVIKKSIGYKLIYDSHAAYFNTNLTNTFLKKIYHFFYQRLAAPKILKEKDGIFAVGSDEQRFLCDDFHLPKKQVPIIRLGVDTQLFSFSRQQRIITRRKLGIRENETVVIYAGKIAPNKDVHILCQAIKSLNDNSIKLVMVGGGNDDYIGKLRSIVDPDQLIIKQFVENKDLPSYYSAGDLGVWPGNWSITIIEAMACGLPVILPWWSGNQFLDKSNGVLKFERGNHTELASKISQFKVDKRLKRKTGKNAPNFVKDYLSWMKIAEQVLKL